MDTSSKSPKKMDNSENSSGRGSGSARGSASGSGSGSISGSGSVRTRNSSRYAKHIIIIMPTRKTLLEIQSQGLGLKPASWQD